MLAHKLPVRVLTSRHTSHYATIAHDSSSNNHHHHWPKTAPHQLHPTPYQVLQTAPGEPYTKTAFLHLVKLYHPDHASRTTTVPSHSALPPHIRLERYRLIVAAHALLSDPSKRAAYDSHGIGWLDNLDSTTLQAAAASAGKAARSARYNATWEDWERWRYEHEAREADAASATGGKPETVYLRNGYFASLLLLLSISAGLAQTMHAENLTEAKRLVREERHWVATQEYRKSQELARKLGREQRIEEFVRARDPAVLEHAGLRGLVMDPDICESGTKEGRAKDLDMRRYGRDK